MGKAIGILAAGALLAGLAWAPPAAAQGKLTSCTLTYELRGWSFLYRTSRGTGRVVCRNGQSANVRIITHGGGLTFGVESVLDGEGVISDVWDIEEVFGGYAEVVGHAGLGPSASGRAMTKGGVGLALGGTGRGINLGFAFGSFKIERG